MIASAQPWPRRTFTHNLRGHNYLVEVSLLFPSFAADIGNIVSVCFAQMMNSLVQTPDCASGL